MGRWGGLFFCVRPSRTNPHVFFHNADGLWAREPERVSAALLCIGATRPCTSTNISLSAPVLLPSRHRRSFFGSITQNMCDHFFPLPHYWMILRYGFSCHVFVVCPHALREVECTWRNDDYPFGGLPSEIHSLAEHVLRVLPSVLASERSSRRTPCLSSALLSPASSSNGRTAKAGVLTPIFADMLDRRAKATTWILLSLFWNSRPVSDPLLLSLSSIAAHADYRALEKT